MFQYFTSIFSSLLAMSNLMSGFMNGILLVFRFFERKTLLDRTPKPHDPFLRISQLNPQFSAENRRFRRLWVGPTVKIHGFRLKTADFQQKTVDFFAENCKFHENHGFWPKTMDF